MDTIKSSGFYPKGCAKTGNIWRCLLVRPIIHIGRLGVFLGARAINSSARQRCSKRNSQRFAPGHRTLERTLTHFFVLPGFVPSQKSECASRAVFPFFEFENYGCLKTKARVNAQDALLAARLSARLWWLSACPICRNPDLATRASPSM